jgi:hypothetical protein
MEQPTGTVGFREVDRNGNPVSGEAYPAVAEDQSGSGFVAGVNPFIVLLWILAALLVGGGAFALINATLATGPMGGTMPISFVLLTFAPFAILIGLAAVICLLFWHARQWQRRRG